MNDNRPWLKNYPTGIPANIDADAYSSLADLPEETFKKYPGSVAFSCMGKDLTFEELDKLSSQFGAYLLSRGLQAGDKVA